jgi:hypothetical protein
MDRVVSMRGRAEGAGSALVGAPVSLATHYADAVLRAQGGAVFTEIEPDGALFVSVALPP